ncbi:MAG TPA: zinc-ribbon domain-containing protein [Candidatus Angelobacter sp.]|nr:zinc-ribbon domain-containing protein [Candidatus Angelobacter sp.]
MDQVAALETAFCPECGRKLAGDEKFCRACGKQLQEQSAANPGTAVAATPVDTTQTKPDPLLAIRVVLLIGAAVSAFTAPVFITLILVVAWLVVMFLPKKSNPH